MPADGETPFRMTPVPGDEGAPAAERVAGPAAGLMIVAVLAVLTNCMASAALSVVIRNAADPQPQPEASGVRTNSERGKAAAPGLSTVCIGGLNLGVYSLVFIGGLRMRSLVSHGAATTGAWVAMLPLSPAFIIGLPIGIWALRVLNDPEVQQAFYKPSRY